MALSGEERASAAAYSPTRSTGTRLAANDPGFTVGAFGVELNFENADISTVSKSILGDVLGLNFLIDPRVQGTVTLASSGPIPRNQVLPVFENALHTANAAVVRDGDILKGSPASATPMALATSASAPPNLASASRSCLSAIHRHR